MLFFLEQGISPLRNFEVFIFSFDTGTVALQVQHYSLTYPSCPSKAGNLQTVHCSFQEASDVLLC